MATVVIALQWIEIVGGEGDCTPTSPPLDRRAAAPCGARRMIGGNISHSSDFRGNNYNFGSKPDTHGLKFCCTESVGYLVCISLTVDVQVRIARSETYNPTSLAVRITIGGRSCSEPGTSPFEGHIPFFVFSFFLFLAHDFQ